MTVLDDPQIEDFFTNRPNINDKRKQSYKTAFDHFYNLFGLTPTKMIEEAKNEQKPDWERKEFLDIEERNVTKYLKQYYLHMKNERKNKNSTIKKNLNMIRAFYEAYNIEIPKSPVLTQVSTRTRKTEIPDWDDVRYVVDKLESKKYIAIVYFLATSGIRNGDVCNLTIGDFLEATKKWHNGTLEDLLSKDPYEENIRPVWDFDPEKTSTYSGNICFTSNTPQAMRALFDYLEKRIDEGYPVGNDTALFRSNIKRKKNNEKSFFYNTSSMSDIFTDTINPLFNTKDKDENIIVRKDRKGYSFFRAHNLRKLFTTTCSTNLPKVMYEVEEKGTLPKNIDILSLLTGREPLNSKITDTYEAVGHDDVEPYYFHIIPYLTVGEIEAKDVHSDEFKELKKQNKELTERMNVYEEFMNNFKK